MRIAAIVLMFLATVLIPIRAAHAYTETGNAAADMAYSLSANRGYTMQKATKIAYYVGGTAAGTSRWARILGRTPVGKVIGIASLAATIYEIYKFADGSWGSSSTNPVPVQQYVFSQNADPAKGYEEFYQRVLAAGYSSAVDISGYYGTSRFIGVRHWAPVDSGGFVGNNVEINSFGSFDYQTLENNAWTSRQIYPNSSPKGDSFTRVERVGDRFYGEVISYLAVDVAGLQWRYQTSDEELKRLTQPVVYDPGEIPGETFLYTPSIAEDINELIKEAALANPDDVDLQELVAEPFTVQEVDDVLPQEDQKRTVASSQIVDPQPMDQPDTGTGSGDGGTGTGSSFDGIQLEVDGAPNSIDVPGIDIGTLDYDPGTCQPFQVGLETGNPKVDAFLVTMGIPKDRVFDPYCKPLEDNADWIRPLLLFFIGFSAFSWFRNG